MKMINEWVKANDFFAELGVKNIEGPLKYVEESDKKYIDGELYITNEICQILTIGYMFEDWI